MAYFKGEESDYETISDEINYLRELFGMPPITYKDIPCSRCHDIFKAQFLGKIKQTHFCYFCNLQLGRADQREHK